MTNAGQAHRLRAWLKGHGGPQLDRLMKAWLKKERSGNENDVCRYFEMTMLVPSDVKDEHLRQVGQFTWGMPFIDFAKRAEKFEFEVIGVFKSLGGKVVVCGRIHDAQIMLAKFQNEHSCEIERRKWVHGKSNGAIEFQHYIHVMDRPALAPKIQMVERNPVAWGTRENMTSLGAQLSQECSDVPVTKWWSKGSGAEFALSWHHNLFMANEIAAGNAQLRVRAAEKGQRRRDAITGTWRDIFDLDRVRSHYVEVPAMEDALRELT